MTRADISEKLSEKFSDSDLDKVMGIFDLGIFGLKIILLIGFIIICLSLWLVVTNHYNLHLIEGRKMRENYKELISVVNKISAIYSVICFSVFCWLFAVLFF